MGPRVGIIGAGLCGLTTARQVERLSPFHVTVFEKQTNLKEPIIRGDFNLPDAKRVLVELQLGGKFSGLKKLAHNQTDPAFLPQQPLLLALAESLRPGTLQLGSAVTRITSCQGLFYCHLEERASPDGPFDVLVLCHGVRHLDHPESDGILLGGDARWVLGHWWDFGTARIRQGANTALIDGVTLGVAISGGLPLGRDILDRCSPVRRKRWELWTWRCLLCLIFFAFFRNL